mmetsp:Transcript_14991/g.42362  ORF Transcript_14991/g.42362 Transcript_14991/m.42362 type:complete len:325 (+) Transcript_14991:923-1897(+)
MTHGFCVPVRLISIRSNMPNELLCRLLMPSGKHLPCLRYPRINRDHVSIPGWRDADVHIFFAKPPPRVIDSMQRDVGVHEEFVDGLFALRPVAVIIDDHDATHSHSAVQREQGLQRRSVEIPVEPQYGDVIDGGIGQRVLEPSRQEPDGHVARPIRRESVLPKRRLDRFHATLNQVRSRRIHRFFVSAYFAILLRRNAGKPLEGIRQPDRPLRDIPACRCPQRLTLHDCRQQRRPALPRPRLHPISRYYRVLPSHQIHHHVAHVPPALSRHHRGHFAFVQVRLRGVANELDAQFAVVLSDMGVCLHQVALAIGSSRIFVVVVAR